MRRLPRQFRTHLISQVVNNTRPRLFNILLIKKPTPVSYMKCAAYVSILIFLSDKPSLVLFCFVFTIIGLFLHHHALWWREQLARIDTYKSSGKEAMYGNVPASTHEKICLLNDERALEYRHLVDWIHE
ncbi:unnamed protein product [Amoebophrya sp. A25]|nr:unnamed protein product [Amoebophrya sp. A25]|eukprot:GSA25T00018808001.1